MATKTIDAGVPNNNPGTGVKAPRTEVTPQQASPPDSPPVLSPARAAVLAMIAALMAGGAALAQFLRAIPAGGTARARVPAVGVAAMPLVVQLLHDRPDAAPTSDPAAITESLALAADLAHLAALLGDYQGQVNETRRLTLADGWRQSRDAYVIIQRNAAGDLQLTTRIAPLQGVFSRGARTQTTQNRADAAQATLTRAQRKAATAAHKAGLAQQRADLAKQAESIAAAERAGAPAPAPTPAPAPAPAPAPTSPR